MRTRLLTISLCAAVISSAHAQSRPVPPELPDAMKTLETEAGAYTSCVKERATRYYSSGNAAMDFALNVAMNACDDFKIRFALSSVKSADKQSVKEGTETVKKRTYVEVAEHLMAQASVRK